MGVNSSPSPRSGPRLSAWAIVGFGVSAAMTWWFVRDIHWAEIKEQLKAVGPVATAAAAGLLLTEFWFRALRWKVVLQPTAPQARTLDLFIASVVGAAGNTLLPMRAGEIGRALVAVRRTGAQLATVLATNLMERITDLFGLVAVLVAMVLLLPEQLGGTEAEQRLIDNLGLYGGILGLGALGAMGTFFALTRRPEHAHRLASWTLKPFSTPLRDTVMRLLDAVLAGFASAGDPSLLRRALLLSLALWFNGSLAIFLLFKAFSLDLPYSAACFTTVAIALTVLLPQAPGFLGVFHVAIEKTLVLWQVPEASAEAFAIVFWAVSFVPVTALGVAATWREGLSLASLKSTSLPDDEG